MRPTSRKRTVVIGAAGFIGTHVCVALHRAGVAVVAAGRSLPKHAAPSPAACTSGALSDPFFEVELQDVQRLGELVGGAETVICLASSSLPATSNADMSSEVRGHVEATVRLAQLAAESGVQRFVFASSGGTVYGRSSTQLVPETSQTEPMSAYGVSKLAIENYLRVLGTLSPMKTLSLRLSNPYGPGQRTDRRHGFIATAIECALQGSPLTIWGDGTTRRDFIFVEDLAQAFLAAIDYDGPESVINIGSGRATSLLEAVALVQDALSVELDLRFERGRTVDVAVNSLCIDRAKCELDWQPTVELNTGITLTGQAMASATTVPQ